MLKNYNLKLFVAVFVFAVSMGSVHAFNPNTSLTTITNNSDNDWLEIQYEEGIKISFLKSEENGNSYLNVKFENTSSATMKFNWSLNKGSDLVENISTITEIPSLGFATEKVQINGGSLTDFSVTINFK